MNIKETYSIDRCLNISLFEYNLIAAKNEFCNSNELMFIAVNPYDPKLFSVAYINTNEIIELLTEKSWINKDDLKDFFNYIGVEYNSLSYERYVNIIKTNLDSFFHTVFDLINYFGLLNFIYDYSPIDIETLNTWFKGLHTFELY